MSEIEKILCYDNNRGIDPSVMAMMNNNGGMGSQWNNPFIYLVWMMFAGRIFGNGFNGDGANNPQIAALQNQMQDNQNSNMIMDAIKGNNQVISQLASNLNCDFNALQGAICDVRNGIDNLAGQVNFSSERVINAVNMGDCHVIEALNRCCCETQKELLRMSGDQKLYLSQQTNVLQNGQRDLQVAIDKGIASSAYQTQQQSCDIINAINASQQRTADLLNSHWNSELAEKYQATKFELSQERQNNYIRDLIAAASGSPARSAK